MKNKLERKEFDSPDMLLEELIEIFNEIPQTVLDEVFQNWIARCNQVILNK